jgi:hypothetical protein
LKKYWKKFINTNSVKFSSAISRFLKKGLIKITTSIDSGTPEKFKEIRGRPRFFEVFENLKKYSEIDSNKITIKYILTDDNKDKNELNSFVENCLKNKLHSCNYQISINYKKDRFDFNFLESIVYLFAKLYSNNIKKIFLDDHIVSRFCSLEENELLKINEYVKENELFNIILNPIEINDLIIFGSGRIAKEIINKTNFIKNIKNYDLIDSDKNKIGELFLNKEIKSPCIIKNDNRKILITSAEFYDEIYNYIKTIKGNTSNILVGLTL